MEKIFDATIVQVGPEAESMIEGANMFILFGEGAPADLAEFCFTMDKHELSGSIHPGSIMKIDGVDLPVTAVGNLVEKNLSALGHISVTLDGMQEESLPGTLHVSAVNAPVLKLHSSVQIFS